MTKKDGEKQERGEKHDDNDRKTERNQQKQEIGTANKKKISD
jgi:hypothetical protein